jgi:hypothetical protein
MPPRLSALRRVKLSRRRRRRPYKVPDVRRTHSSSCFQTLRLEALNTTLQRKARVGFGMALRTAWYTFAEVIRLGFLMVVFRER